jgi:hypothetical protein
MPKKPTKIEATTSANVGVYEVPLGAPIVRYSTGKPAPKPKQENSGYEPIEAFLRRVGR